MFRGPQQWPGFPFGLPLTPQNTGGWVGGVPTPRNPSPFWRRRIRPSAPCCRPAPRPSPPGPACAPRRPARRSPRLGPPSPKLEILCASTLSQVGSPHQDWGKGYPDPEPRICSFLDENKSKEICFLLKKQTGISWKGKKGSREEKPIKAAGAESWPRGGTKRGSPCRFCGADHLPNDSSWGPCSLYKRSKTLQTARASQETHVAYPSSKHLKRHV